MAPRREAAQSLAAAIITLIARRARPMSAARLSGTENGMQFLAWLIPISLLMGSVGLVAFIYSVRSNQYDDPEGDARRILTDEWDDRP